eukprot:TRINITY_DN19473_c0_g1_i1.p1 TRINITY_DN19473_c0_g1~~TRINITY_DN19473_c0_g1_i1.p1  ORF type:complete len:211 (-),score=49.05 TRINITY_DN19473_c0_g1_i1:105-737(-)
MGCTESKAKGSGNGQQILGSDQYNPPSGFNAPPRVKLVLLGDSGVGKSCLVTRYVRGVFDPDSKITVGAAFMAHTVNLKNGQSVKFEIWDTAGQERYRALAPLYYRGAEAAAIVYDVTHEPSFRSAQRWVRELNKNSSQHVVIILVGNKTDLIETGTNKREVSLEEAAEYAEKNQMMHLECSAKTGTNVELLFQKLAQEIVTQRGGGTSG